MVTLCETLDEIHCELEAGFTTLREYGSWNPENFGELECVPPFMNINHWLVVSNPLKNIGQLGDYSQYMEKIKSCSKPPTMMNHSQS